MLQGKRFVVTGATGRLGCALVARLEELSAEVVPLVLLGYPTAPKRTRWVADASPIVISSRDELSKFGAVDHVIHLHWLVDRRRTPAGQLVFETDMNINQLGYFWDWVKTSPPRHFSNISSIRVFGPKNSETITRNTEPRPSTPYGIAKVAAEHFVDISVSGSETKVCHLRLPSTTSVGEHPNQLMTQLHASATWGKEITVNIGHRTHLMYIDDMVDCLVQASIVEIEGRYNLVPPGIDNREIAARFEGVSHKRLNANYLNITPGVDDLVYSSDLAMLDAPWMRHTSLEEIIAHFQTDAT